MSARRTRAPVPKTRARTPRAGGAVPARSENAAGEAQPPREKGRERPPAAPRSPLRTGQAVTDTTGCPVQTP